MQLASEQVSRKEQTMNVTDVAYMSAAMVALVALRFGIPVVVTWLIGKAASHFTHASS
jgi:hypothetical protein